ncbi:MAG: ADP-ribosylglycohydrolase family protein [Microcoleaceae cyanobacterium]
MGHSLLSQFQGSLLGVSLGLYSQYLAQSPRNLPSTSVLSSHRLDLILTGINTLIDRPEISWEDWHQIWQADDSSLQPESLKVIATLPVMLFFHENPGRLRHQLQQAAQEGQVKALNQTVSSENTASELFILAEAIAELLKPSSNLQELIPQLLTQVSSETKLAQQLTQVHLLWQQDTGLETAIHRLIPNFTPSLELTSSVAVAMYCFLSTPSAFSVSLRRAMRFNPDFNLACAMTAALSGAYNGLAGIPTAWRLQLRKLMMPTSNSTSQLAPENLIPIDQQILNQSAQLFQTWAGLYSLTPPNTNPLTSSIVAVPISLPN